MNGLAQIKDMTIEEAKSIDLREFLSAIDCKEVKIRGCNYWYLSPFRDEHDASFKVNAMRNEWYDFGIDKGGNIIELGKILYNTSYIPAILHHIEIHAANISHEKKVPLLQASIGETSKSNVHLQPLSHPALLYYVRGRSVDVEVAKAYCKEVHYQVRGRSYYGIAFLNRSGGMEIRNPFFKGCEGGKDISIVSSMRDYSVDQCCVFEGFFDFLSYVTLMKQGVTSICLTKVCDYIILNSVNNINKAFPVIGQYEHIHCYLDNDNAGHKATEKLASIYPSKVIDESFRYHPHNDLNDVLRLGRNEKANKQSTTPRQK